MFEYFSYCYRPELTFTDITIIKFYTFLCVKIYKNADLGYLKDMQFWDELTHINNIKMSEYCDGHLESFYTGG